jgi:hypothetical protein
MRARLQIHLEGHLAITAKCKQSSYKEAQTRITYKDEMANLNSIPFGRRVINANKHEDLVRSSGIELGWRINGRGWGSRSLGEGFDAMR